jgi:hypothetical protein
MQARELEFLYKLSLGGWDAPKTCVCTHVVYKSVVGSNVEAPGVSGYTHAHALTPHPHACSRLGFLWKSSTRENHESIWDNSYYYHNPTQSNIKVH